MIVNTFTKDNEIYSVVETIEVQRHYQVDNFKDPSGKNSELDGKKIVVIDSKIKTKLYTDGEFVKIEEEDPQTISEYFINKEKYNGNINRLIKKKVYIKNASYILVVVVANELMKNGSVMGHFPVIKDTKIFIKDKNDKKAKKIINETLKIISNQKQCDSIFDVLFAKSNNKENKIDYEKINDDTYKLKSKSR